MAIVFKQYYNTLKYKPSPLDESSLSIQKHREKKLNKDLKIFDEF